VASYTLRTIALEGNFKDNFDNKKLAIAGVSGALSGVLGTWIGGDFFNKNSKTILSTIQRTNFATNVLNGGISRMADAIYDDESVVRNTFFGLAEGAFSAIMFNDKFFNSFYKNTNQMFVRTLTVHAASNFVTSVPGLSSMLFSVYMIPKMTFINKFNPWAMGISFFGNWMISSLSDKPSNYPTKVGNFELKPYGLWQLVKQF
jgi:hypothetical protein